MVNSVRELDMLTVGYAFDEVDTERMMRGAAPDIYIFHAGITRGGSTSYGSGRSLEDVAAHTQALGAVAKAIKPDVILLAHGASLIDPHDAQYLLENCDCHGIQVGSSIERLGIEKPLEQRAASFKTIRFPANAKRSPS
jgi:predicted TIM-barrel enzyme